MAHEYVLGDRMFTIAPRREFRVASVHHRRAGESSVDLPEARWGCDGGPNDLVSTRHREAHVRQNAGTSCFDYKTLGDELDEAGLSWRFYTSKVNRDGGEWSGYQAIQHIRYGPDWKKDMITPQTQFITDVGKGILATLPGSHRSATTPTTLTAAEASGRRGCRHSSTRSARAATGIRRRFS